MVARENVKNNRVNVNILNEEYVITGKAEAKHIEKVAAYVDSKMRELTLRYPHLSPGKVAVLTAVNITDEYFRLAHDHDALIGLLDEDRQK